MRRVTSVLLLLFCFIGSGVALWGQASNPQSPNAAQMQGPDPTGNQGYPFAVVGAPNGDPVRVNVVSGVSSSVTQGTSPWLVAGLLLNNNAAPGSNNLGVLGAIANAAPPSWTEGYMTGLSVDLAGNLRVVTTGGGGGSVTQGTSPWVVGFNGVAQPVSQNGTWTVQQGTPPWLVSQSGTWNVGLSAGANTVGKVDQGAGGSSAWKVDGSAVTQPVSGTFWQATQPVSGTITANAGTGTFTTAGAKTNNNAAPGATNVGTLPAVANAAAPSWTEGNQVALSTDLAGNLRTAGTATVSGTVTANAGSGTFTVGGTVTANAGSGTFTVDGSGHTQPVSGTVTANQGGAPWSAVGTLTNNNAAPGATNVGVLGARATAAAPTYTEGNQVVTSTDLAGSLRTNITNTPAVSQSGTWNVGLSAGSNTVGKVDQGAGGSSAWKVDGSAVTQPVSGTFWQATQPVSGTVTANQGGTWTVQPGNTANTTAWKVDGSAVTQPVSGTFWQATQPVSGTVTANQGGTWTVQPGNTANTTAWKVDGSAVTQPVSGTFWQATQPVSGTVTANAGSGTFTVGGTVTANAGTGNFATNTAQVNGSTVSTAATGVQKVGIVGSAGATVDSTVAAGAAPTNQVVVGAVYNTSAPAPTGGQAMALQADQAGNHRVTPGIATAALSAWSSGTALNATQNIFTNSGVSSVLVHLVQTSTLTAGAITFEVTYDNANWITISADCVIDPTSTTLGTISLPYTVQATTNKGFLLLVKGAQGLRIKHSTQITGTGTVTPNYALLAYNAVQQTTAVQSGTWTVQPGNTANTTAWKVDGSAVTQPVSGTITANQGGAPWSVAGPAAHGGAISANPNRIAGRSANADITQTGNGQTTDLLADLAGKLIVLPYTFPENFESGKTSDVTTTGATSVIPTAGVGVRNYITQVTIINSHATVNTWVNITDGSGGTVLYTAYCQNSGGGVAATFPVPLRTTANTALFMACETTGANVRVSASGYKAP